MITRVYIDWLHVYVHYKVSSEIIMQDVMLRKVYSVTGISYYICSCNIHIEIASDDVRCFHTESRKPSVT